MPLFNFGTLAALVAASAAYYAVEGDFRANYVLPYPSAPFQLAAAFAAFCGIKFMLAAAELAGAVYSKVRKHKSKGGILK